MSQQRAQSWAELALMIHPGRICFGIEIIPRSIGVDNLEVGSWMIDSELGQHR